MTSSSYAFVRELDNSEFHEMFLVTILLLAIVGLIVGVLCGICGIFLRRIPWNILFVLFVGVVVTLFMFPFVGWLLATLAMALLMISLPIAASIFYLVRGGLFRPRLVGASPTSADGEPQNSKTAHTSNLLRWITGTYVFWVIVSLANIKLLFPLAAPLLIPIYLEAVRAFLPFILPPLAVALGVGVVVTVFFARRSCARQYVAPLVFNACVLLTFLGSAEVFRHYLMSQSLREHKPNHFQSSSFLTSVFTYRLPSRLPHASFDEDGKTFHWSYAKRKFIQVP